MEMEDYYKNARDPDFEARVKELADEAIMKMPDTVANEVRLRYVTHVFAKTLDEVAKYLIKPKFQN